MAEVLLSLYNAIFATRSLGESLYIAVSYGRLEEVEKLLKKATINDLNWKNEDGKTALMWASSKGDTQVVNLLLAHSNIDVNQQDKDGKTALMWAFQSLYIEVVKLLLAYSKIDVNQQDKDGKTALMWASSGGHTEVVKLLLAHSNIDVNQQDKDGRTALMQALEKKEVVVVKFFLAHKFGHCSTLSTEEIDLAFSWFLTILEVKKISFNDISLPDSVNINQMINDEKYLHDLNTLNDALNKVKGNQFCVVFAEVDADSEIFRMDCLVVNSFLSRVMGVHRHINLDHTGLASALAATGYIARNARYIRRGNQNITNIKNITNNYAPNSAEKVQKLDGNAPNMDQTMNNPVGENKKNANTNNSSPTPSNTINFNINISVSVGVVEALTFVQKAIRDFMGEKKQEEVQIDQKEVLEEKDTEVAD